MGFTPDFLDFYKNFLQISRKIHPNPSVSFQLTKTNHILVINDLLRCFGLKIVEKNFTKKKKKKKKIVILSALFLRGL